jgi:hypothetical protein
MVTHSITGIGDVERRELISAGLRASLSTGVLLAAYGLLPITRHGGHGRPTLIDVGTMLRLGVGIAIFLSVLVLEIRAISKAKHRFSCSSLPGRTWSCRVRTRQPSTGQWIGPRRSTLR